ncbi:hypothetical protein TRVL_07304 [Trypanosoma vivax]|nr:hypothetical protein TRVL_07304 [Trypanosoma vivax]
MATSRSQLRQQAACAATNINDTPQAVDTVRLHAAVIGSTSLRQALNFAFLCSFALLSLISPMCAKMASSATAASRTQQKQMQRRAVGVFHWPHGDLHSAMAALAFTPATITDTPSMPLRPASGEQAPSQRQQCLSSTKPFFSCLR